MPKLEAPIDVYAVHSETNDVIWGPIVVVDESELTGIGPIAAFMAGIGHLVVTTPQGLWGRLDEAEAADEAESIVS